MLSEAKHLLRFIFCMSACVRNHDYWVYILTNKHCTTLYIGITNNIARRLIPASGMEKSTVFTKRYHLNRLVWVEHFRNVNDAIACEKKLKGWRRSRKIALIEQTNPSVARSK